MTNLELMTILGNVRGEYILQAQELRSGNAKKVIRKVSRKRVFLIAAVIALLLLLAGCAAVLIGIQKINLGHVIFSDVLWQNGAPYERDVLSLNGYKDSPGYLAAQEWLAFENSYDKDGSLLKNADHSGYELPQDYFAYQCYTQEMQDKIDEICGKYGLELAGPIYFPDRAEQALFAVEVPSIENSELDGDISIDEGRYYRSGSFVISGELQHRFADRQDADTVMFSYDCTKRSVFFPGYITTPDADSFDSWEYTSQDGVNLMLAQNRERGLIISDNGDCVISIVLYFSLGESIEVNNPGLRKDLEQIADMFAYTIHPKAPKEPWLVFPNTPFPEGYDPKAAELKDNTRSSYDAYFANWMPGSVASEAYSPDYQQKFLDLDGDGDDEMLIWNVRTGVVYEVVTRVDGSTVCIYGGGQYGLDDHTAELYQCEGNILERQFANGTSPQGRQLNEYYRIQDRQMVMVECVSYGNDGKWYWSESGGASSVMWREITEEEYDAVLAKYTRVQGETWEDQPLSDSAKAALKKEADERLLLCLKDQYAFYRPEDGMEYTLADYCRKESAELGFPVSITRYTFVDMDGDGVQEAVVDFRFGENEQVMCMVLRYYCGTIYGTEYYHRQMSNIKEDGTFAYSGGGDNDGWAKLRWENMEWVTEKVGSIYYGDNLKDVTWYPYPVNSDMNGDG